MNLKVTLEIRQLLPPLYVRFEGWIQIYKESNYLVKISWSLFILTLNWTKISFYTLYYITQLELLDVFSKLLLIVTSM